MNSKFSRLLMAPVLAGALFGVTMFDAQGAAEAAGPYWKGYNKPSGVDCGIRFGGFKVKDARDEAFKETFNDAFDQPGAVCGLKVRYNNWIGSHQYGKNNQFNGALFSQNIVQVNNLTNGSTATNEANRNIVGFEGTDALFLQSNINVNGNRIKNKPDSSGEEAIDINIDARTDN